MLKTFAKPYSRILLQEILHEFDELDESGKTRLKIYISDKSTSRVFYVKLIKNITVEKK